MANTTFTKIIQEAVGVNMESDEMMALDSVQLEKQFKIDDLKKILKHSRQYGYRTVLSKNKRALAMDLHSLIRDTSINLAQRNDLNSEIRVGSLVHTISQPPSATNKSQDASSSSSSAASLIRANYQPTAAANKSQSASSSPSSSSSSTFRKSIYVPVSKVITSARETGQLGSSSLSTSQQDTSKASALAAPASKISKYQDIHDELLEWGCFTSNQITTAILQRLSKNGAITQDLLVNDLVGGSDVPFLSESDRIIRESENQRQFEQDMDRAILESEEDREHIQACKKQRTLELKTNFSCVISDACEYQKSYLLGKRCVESDSSLPVVNIVQEVVSFLDSLSMHCNITENQTSSSGSREAVLNKEVMQDIRSVVFTLLDLEMKSYKWYKDRALGYFINMNQSIAKVCDADRKTDYKKLFRKYVFSDAVNSKNEEFRNVRIILDCLRAKIDCLSKDLYSMSGTSIPQAFLDCDPERKHEPKYSIEDDGFEIV